MVVGSKDDFKLRLIPRLSWSVRTVTMTRPSQLVPNRKNSPFSGVSGSSIVSLDTFTLVSRHSFELYLGAGVCGDGCGLYLLISDFLADCLRLHRPF